MEAVAAQQSSTELVLHVRNECGALEATVGQQLLAELEAALAFADYCSFIGREQVSRRAEQLARLAQELYDDTLSSMHQHADGSDPSITADET